MKIEMTNAGPFVMFTKEDRAKALELGHYKHDKSERDGRRADWYDGTERDNHADGVGGEMAVAFYLNQNFEFRVDTFKAADIGANIEVRTTRSRWFDLKVKERDKDHRIAIALRQYNDCGYLILGWMTVKEAKALGELKDPNDRGKPAYFVAPGKLHTIETLPR